MTQQTLPRTRPAVTRTILGIRDLTPADLPKIREPRAMMAQTQKLRDTHHRVARLVAAGLRKEEVAERAGYSLQRVHTLTKDPAFVELVAHYRTMVDEAYVANVDTFFDMATNNMRVAERMIAEQLESADETQDPIALKTLLALTADRMDRFGYGKNKTQTNVNVDFAATLEKAIARSNSARTVSPPLSPTVVDLHPAPQPGQPLEPDSSDTTPAEPSPAHSFERKI